MRKWWEIFNHRIRQSRAILEGSSACRDLFKPECKSVLVGLTATHFSHLFADQFTVCHSMCVWPTALKLGCITNFDILFLLLQRRANARNVSKITFHGVNIPTSTSSWYMFYSLRRRRSTASPLIITGINVSSQILIISKSLVSLKRSLETGHTSYCVWLTHAMISNSYFLIIISPGNVLYSSVHQQSGQETICAVCRTLGLQKESENGVVATCMFFSSTLCYPFW